VRQLDVRALALRDSTRAPAPYVVLELLLAAAAAAAAAAVLHFRILLLVALDGSRRHAQGLPRLDQQSLPGLRDGLERLHGRQSLGAASAQHPLDGLVLELVLQKQPRRHRSRVQLHGGAQVGAVNVALLALALLLACGLDRLPHPRTPPAPQAQRAGQPPMRPPRVPHSRGRARGTPAAPRGVRVERQRARARPRRTDAARERKEQQRDHCPRLSSPSRGCACAVHVHKHRV